MGLSLSWGGSRLIVAVAIENGIRVFIPLSIFYTSAGVTSVVDWASKADDSETLDIPGGGTASPLRLTPREAEMFEAELVSLLEADRDGG